MLQLDTNRQNSADMAAPETWDEAMRTTQTDDRVFESDDGQNRVDNPARYSNLSPERPTPQQIAGAASLEVPDQLVLSQHLFIDFDMQLSRGENRPTLLYKVCLVGWIPFGLMCPFGMLCYPSVATAWNNEDLLMIYFLLAMSMIWTVIAPLFVAECRWIFRADAQGPLILLGAGKQLISVAQDKAVRRHNMILNHTFGLPRANRIGSILPSLVWVAMFLPFIITGIGARTPYGHDLDGSPDGFDEENGIGKLQVRLTAFFALFGCCTATPIYYTWGTALMLGAKLINAKTNSIRAAVHHERQAPSGDAHWVTTVVEPCKELVAALSVLSVSFSRGLICQTVYFLLFLTMVPCALFSTFYSDLWKRMGHPDPHLDVHPLLPYTFLTLALSSSFLTAAMTLMPVYMVGAVSTYCDDLVEDLNELRLEHFTDEVDERVAKLERAFKARLLLSCFGDTNPTLRRSVSHCFLNARGVPQAVNHGQGIGFKVLGLVLTKKVLVIIFLEFLTGLLFVVPIVWSNSGGWGDYMYTAKGGRNSPCTLPDSNKTAMRSTLDAFNCSHADWFNVTIASLLE
jgi:hypothetical protein